MEPDHACELFATKMRLFSPKIEICSRLSRTLCCDLTPYFVKEKLGFREALHTHSKCMMVVLKGQVALDRASKSMKRVCDRSFSIMVIKMV